jgi:hypothetical protein
VTEQQSSPPTEQPHEHEARPSRLIYPIGIVLLLALALYGYLLHQGYPQHWTELSLGGHAEHAVEQVEGAPALAGEAPELPANAEAHSEAIHSAEHHPPYIMVAPFAALLLCIAILPLIPALAHRWERNSVKFAAAAGLGIITLLYYYFGCNFPVEQHWPNHAVIEPASGGFAIAKTVFLNAIVNEFFPFIVLLFSLSRLLAESVLAAT